MATYFFGINNGAGSTGSVTEQSSTTGKDVEIRINTTANVPSKTELLIAMQKLVDYIATASKNW